MAVLERMPEPMRSHLAKLPCPSFESHPWVQGPLWATTGTKNPAYDETVYVDSLIGRETVNTVPPSAL